MESLLAIAISFTSPKDEDDPHDEELAHSKSNNINFTLYNNADQVVDELFQDIKTN